MPRTVEPVSVDERGMFGTAVSISSSSARGAWGRRWNEVRDLLGGVLVLVVWAALWTSVWAAVAGPLSPVGQARAEVEVADAR